jgi:acetyltransferase-like isoleucine patch superfamily enzyme
MIGLAKRAIRYYVFKTGRGKGLFKRFCHPTGYEWADYLARWGGIYSVGKGVWINPGANIPDPTLLRLGDNVGLSDCTILGHDGLVGMLQISEGKMLDSVGAVDIFDNCFIGYQSIIMPGRKIGPNSIVAAGAVVTRDVPPGVVVGGNPAKVLCTVEDLIKKIEERCEAYPWMELIRQRATHFDPDYEPKLKAMRAQYFFGEKANE